MKKLKKSMTAADLVAQLNADPEFLARQKRQDEDFARRAAELRRAESPLVEELRSVGYAVDSVWDLVNTAAPYPRALPVLFSHLERPYPAPVREGIARALAVPQARSGWHHLARLFRDESERRVKDGLAVALSGASDETVLPELIGLARDAQHGESRLLLLRAIARSSHPQAMTALSDLRTDPDLKKEIAVIMRWIRRRTH